jgi:hypothetical protein
MNTKANFINADFSFVIDDVVEIMVSPISGVSGAPHHF